MNCILMFILLFVLLGIAGCTDTAGILPAPSTRTLDIHTPLPGNAVSSAFSAGDRIGIYPVRYTDGKEGILGDVSNPMNACYTYTPMGWEADPDEEIYLDDTPVDIYAFFPYDPEMSRKDGKTNLTAYPFDVSGSQADENKDVLWAKASLVSINQPAVELQFRHLMSRVELNLKYPEASTGQPVVRLYNIQTESLIDLRKGETHTTGKPGIIIPAVQTETATGFNQTFVALLPPQKIMAGTPLLTVELNGNVLQYTLPEGIAFNAPNNYTFNLTIDEEALLQRGNTRLLITPIITVR